MIEEVTFRQNGGSLEVTLPKAMTDRLNLGLGDKAYAVETDQGILITPQVLASHEVMEAEARISNTYSNTLRELAK